jgi:DNA-binding response OmpR family regulator
MLSCSSPAKAGRRRRVQRLIVTPFSHLHQGAHIVCADRKPELLELIVTTLRSEDHCVFQAFDGLAALELTLSLRQVDLLVTNTSMPGMNGPELIRQVREKLPTLPILYVKNLDSPNGVPEGLPPDVPILPEPFTAEELSAAVRRLLVDH